MTNLRHFYFAAAGVFAVAANSASAATLLTYDFVGQPGNEASVSPTTTAANLTGLAITRSNGLTATSAANSIVSSNWTVGQYYTLGLTVASGFSVSVNQLLLNTRASGTGPGTINVQASIDSGAFTTITTLTQGNATDDVQTLNFAPLSGIQSIVFRFTDANTVSASGGTVASTGTFRLENYNYVNTNNTGTPFQVNGTVTSLPTAVPEPATWGMVIVGFGLVGGAMRVRRKATIRFA